MKAITLTQPWATAVVLRLKRYETRSWSTGYRGELAIHAAKGWRAEDRDFARDMSLYYSLGSLLPERLPLGAVIGTVTLRDCLPTRGLDVSHREHQWGDFSDGRWAWLLDVVSSCTPIPARGALGLWEWEAPSL